MIYCKYIHLYRNHKKFGIALDLFVSLVSLHNISVMEKAYDKYGLFKRGADNGFVFGLYLTAMFFASAYSLTIPTLGLVALVMMCGVPVITYYYLNKGYTKEYGTATFSTLWMQGIVMFFCGSLIMALAAYLFLRWIQPDYITSLLTTARDTYNALDWERGHEIADTIDLMIDQHLVPTAIQVAMEFLWLGVFSGSMLSILTALLVGAARRRTRIRP